jgi:hypothetical protein
MARLGPNMPVPVAGHPASSTADRGAGCGATGYMGGHPAPVTSPKAKYELPYAKVGHMCAHSSPLGEPGMNPLYSRLTPALGGGASGPWS